MITVSPAYAIAKATIADFLRTLDSEKNATALMPHVYQFEDTMNELSGEIQNLEYSLQTEIQVGCASCVKIGASQGVEISLYQSLLPPPSVVGTEEEVRTAKKLYPLTTTVTVYPAGITENVTTGSTTTENVTTIAASVETEVEEIDPIFEELDDEPIEEETLAEIQTETAPYITDALVALALTAAANANGLQAGLTTFSHNPLASLIDSTKATLLYYTENNYANLNVALSGISSDVALAAEYKILRESVGGPDGLSGCVTQMDFFKEHTDRLSGLILDVDSPNDVIDNDSTDEYLNIDDMPVGPTVIFSFDSRYFRSAKYMIQATAVALDRGHQATELYILHDNHHAYTREIAAMYTQDPFVTYTTRLLNNRVEVIANTVAANTDYVVHGVKLRIARAARSYGDMSQTKIIEQHEILSSYLDDGVDYVALQSASLQKGSLVAILAREFVDMILNYNSPGFLVQSTGAKQTQILAMANTLKTRYTDIQTAIETDYTNFETCRRKAEALDIAYNLATAQTDATSNTITSLTLNTETLAAIESDE